MENLVSEFKTNYQRHFKIFKEKFLGHIKDSTGLEQKLLDRIDFVFKKFNKFSWLTTTAMEERTTERIVLLAW